MNRKRLWSRRIAIAVAGLGVLLFAAFLIVDKARPFGVEGEQAEDLAKKMLRAINHEAWLNTGALQWTFAEKHQHLWDKERHLARVRWQEFEVLIDLNTKSGLAFSNGNEVGDAAAAGLVEDAWKKWINDSFWLNPVSKCFDNGTTRSLIQTESQGAALLVSYGSGGATPGDAYLWFLDENGLPTSWQMWVSNIPVGGLAASWEDWQTLATGVRVAGSHKIAFLDLRLNNIKAGFHLSDLVLDSDPFARLIEIRKEENK